ncbi:hypothetical protein DY000_02061627 [Brassica cretica]|uniref:KIB1-4 beta-propeller domain-containing protein n=1 Tax=Brassica cretica TaxID=69181 RepID=A0ABQ7AVR0_BRACR|nr:hypothetical protein DY000_02061627 [Brassica cretica]
MVFKVTPKGNAFYTRHLGNVTIFISKSESFSVRASSFPGVSRNQVYILDDTEIVLFSLDDSTISSSTDIVVAPYFLPPQNIEY